MTDFPPDLLPSLHADWQASLSAELAADERALAWVELDLDAKLHFAQGLAVVTNRRILAHAPGEVNWNAWSFHTGLSLQHSDHAGVGTLELVDAQGQLACWRYTLAQNVAALRLIKQFERQMQSVLSGQAAAPEEEMVCPTCKAPLEPDQEECPVCSREIHEAPSTWTLFRLWRFAKPYKKELLIGFMLTLVATAANMVPPYLTMPLMDDVLIPYQNGKPIDINVVLMLLGGLLGAALVAWSLGWARTYILALVSERIGADLRTTTYEHLLHLSLEYFGSKRT